MPKISVCYSPAAYSLFAEPDQVVVVVDILRATSAMVTAFYHGVDNIIPVATVEEARDYKAKGYLAAAERDGMVLEGFEIGNSPFCYMGEEVKNKTIVITTTNGTKAINVAKKEADTILIGSFLNLNYLAEHLNELQKNVLVLCAGWKDKFNLEDTLFAGALSEVLIDKFNYQSDCDSAIAGMHLYKLAKNDLNKFLENSSHRKRLKKLELEQDIEYCLTLDICPVIPYLQHNKLKKLKQCVLKSLS
jgi:2-phosphosulfolactate phosphatase